jgi:hypothetical protein
MKAIKTTLILTIIFLGNLQSMFASEVLAETYYALPTGSMAKDLGPERTERVDWSPLFKSKIDIQSSGTCHSYAMTALIESRCRQITGRPIELSSAYFNYLHLRYRLNEVDFIHATDLLSETESGTVRQTGFYVERFKKGVYALPRQFQLTSIQVENSLNELSLDLRNARISIGKVYREKVREFAGQHPLQFRRSLDRLNGKVDSIYSDAIRTDFDNMIANGIALPSSDPSPTFGHVLHPNDVGVNTCIRHFGNLKTLFNPTRRRMTDLLKRGNPFICLGNLEFTMGIFPGSTAFQKKGGHALIVYGYLRDKKSDKTEFLVRDSNFKNLNPYTVTGCEFVQYIDPYVSKEEYQAESYGQSKR